jgi:hypothetical protein
MEFNNSGLIADTTASEFPARVVFQSALTYISPPPSGFYGLLPPPLCSDLNASWFHTRGTQVEDPSLSLRICSINPCRLARYHPSRLVSRHLYPRQPRPHSIDNCYCSTTNSIRHGRKIEPKEKTASLRTSRGAHMPQGFRLRGRRSIEQA